MCSYNAGKDEVCEWIRQHVPKDATVLDVGPCDGKWRTLLPEYPNMDACEIYAPNADQVRHMYRDMYVCDIANLVYAHYDLIIFGDVIEHMPVERAQAVLKHAEGHCNTMIVSVPYLLPQGPIYGNPWEKHIQDDLTKKIFNERYPGFSVIWETNNYAYFYKSNADSLRGDKGLVQLGAAVDNVTPGAQ